MGRDGRTELHSETESTSLPVENISPAREMREAGPAKTPSAPQPALRTASGGDPPVVIYGTDSDARRRAAAPPPPPPPPDNSGMRLLLGVALFAALSGGVWWLMRDRPVAVPMTENAAAAVTPTGALPAPQSSAAVTPPRFDLRGVPVPLFVEGDLPAALRQELTGSEQIIASEFMTRTPGELRAQISPRLPHAALFSAWLALREGHSGDCINNAGLARVGTPQGARYLEAACQLMALNYPAALALSDFPEARFNHEVVQLLTGPVPGAEAIAGRFAQSDSPAALYLAGRYRLATRDAAGGRTLLNRARSLAHSSAEKTEIEKYMTGR